jgi:hypothetical protein
MPQSCYPTVPFPIDHIIARQHGGSTSLENLALSCLHEICTGPAPSGYRDRRILPPGEHVGLTIDGNEIGPIAVSAMLPRNRAAEGSGRERNS